MRICVVGLGYIGLPMAVMFANNGCNVIGVDISDESIKTLSSGHIHIEEEGLEKMVEGCLEKGSLTISKKPVSADAYMITVPTPNACDRCLSCDIRFVLAACKEILPYLLKENTVIIESTVAPGTLEDYIVPFFEKAGFHIGQDLYLAHCPGNVLSGKSLYEMRYNNQIVGGITKECTKRAAKLYQVFVEGKIIKTDAKTAEIAKCMENTYRDVNLALANELVRICDNLKINCLEAIKIANEHPRVNILSPGPGVDEHCLAVDPYFIYSKIPRLAKLIKTARDINSSMPEFVVEKIVSLLREIKNPIVSVFWGTYKGNRRDLKESPAYHVIELLKADGFDIRIYNQFTKEKADKDVNQVVRGSDLIVLLSDEDEIKEIDYDMLAERMRRPYVFDTIGIIDPYLYTKVQVINYGNIYEFV